MTTYVVLLRAINVGGRGKLPMSDLRDCFTNLGFARVRTLLQSGNAVLQAKESDGARLEKRLETELLKKLKLRTDIFIRSASQWNRIISGNPFPKEAARDPSHLLVMMTKQFPTELAMEALKTAAAAAAGGEIARAHDGQPYVFFPAGVGRSRLTTKVIERTLQTTVTARNWNTVLKLANLIAAK